MTKQQFHTVFGSLNDYVKGDLEIINDDPKHYAFSNVFDVASKSRPYEKGSGGIESRICTGGAASGRHVSLVHRGRMMSLPSCWTELSKWNW